MQCPRDTVVPGGPDSPDIFLLTFQNSRQFVLAGVYSRPDHRDRALRLGTFAGIFKGVMAQAQGPAEERCRSCQNQLGNHSGIPG